MNNLPWYGWLDLLVAVYFFFDWASDNFYWAMQGKEPPDGCRPLFCWVPFVVVFIYIITNIA